MARIAGVDLPGRKHTFIALQYIYGIGKSRALQICEMAGIPRDKPAEDLDEQTFFTRHLKPWAPRFFADLSVAKAATFYRPVGVIGRLMMDIESRAYELAR